MRKLLYFTLPLTALLGCDMQPSSPTSGQTQPSVAIQKQVSLLPYHGFDTSLIPALQQAIAKFYRCRISILPAQPLPNFAYYPPRKRYKADSLLAYQRKIAAQRIIVGLTHQDISTSSDKHADWGVFGLGYCPGQACVISTWRLLTNSKALLQERLHKVVLHELGHNFGLPHCTNNEPFCLMNDAKGTMAQVDKEQFWLCNACNQRLH